MRCKHKTTWGVRAGLPLSILSPWFLLPYLNPKILFVTQHTKKKEKKKETERSFELLSEFVFGRRVPPYLTWQLSLGPLACFQSDFVVLASAVRASGFSSLVLPPLFPQPLKRAKNSRCKGRLILMLVGFHISTKYTLLFNFR